MLPARVITDTRMMSGLAPGVRMRARGRGYQLSQRCRKLIEELFGEAKDWHWLRVGFPIYEQSWRFLSRHRHCCPQHGRRTTPRAPRAIGRSRARSHRSRVAYFLSRPSASWAFCAERLRSPFLHATSACRTRAAAWFTLGA